MLHFRIVILVVALSLLPLRAELAAAEDGIAGRFPVQPLGDNSARDSATGADHQPERAPRNARFPIANSVGLPVLEMPPLPVERSQAEQGQEVLRWVLASDVLFDFDKSDIRPEGEKALRDFLVELSRITGSLRLSIEGHTDAIGTDQYNQTLSVRRANAVAAWLSSNSPSLPRFTAIGFGEKRPAAPNTKRDGSDDPEGRQLNRRVEIVVRANP